MLEGKLVLAFLGVVILFVQGCAISTAPTPTAVPIATPAPTPTPRSLSLEPYGPVLINDGATQVVPLGHLEQGTSVRLTIGLSFDNSLLGLGEQPSADIAIRSDSGVEKRWNSVGNGFLISWQVPSSAQWQIALTNSRSSLTGIWVTLRAPNAR